MELMDILLDEVVHVTPHEVFWPDELIMYPVQLHEIVLDLDIMMEVELAITDQVNNADALSDADTEEGGFA
jgi:hypothetical protein